MIPNTWIVCGEGNNFCSDECLEKFEENKKLLEQSKQDHIIETNQQLNLKQK